MPDRCFQHRALNCDVCRDPAAGARADTMAGGLLDALDWSNRQQAVEALFALPRGWRPSWRSERRATVVRLIPDREKAMSGWQVYLACAMALSVVGLFLTGLVATAFWLATRAHWL